MSDELRGSPSEGLAYEPPKVTLIGNARELLAGAIGSLPENPGPIVQCSDATKNPSNGC
jgi:hypothetical protein